MDVAELLIKLRKNNIDVGLCGKDLEISYDGEGLPGLFFTEIKNNKEAIVSFLKLVQGAASNNASIPKAAIQESYVLSSSQKRLWILSQFADANKAYAIPCTYVLEGQLNKEALERSFHSLLERHEIMRSVFKQDDQGEVYQYVKDVENTGFKIEYHDLREIRDKEKEAKRLIQENTACSFDLCTGPLIRTALIQIQRDKWILNCTLHHIISDGWSMSVMIRDLFRLYNACNRGEQHPLKPLTIQYKDYATWQQKQLQEGLLNEHKQYWLRQLSGDLPVLELPGDKNRPAIRTYNGGLTGRQIDKALTDQLKELAQKQGVSLFMSLLAIVNVLLYRYSGEREMIIGTPIAGRDHIDLEEQVGLYINTLALRISLEEHESYLQLLERVKQVTLEAYQHQSYPFDELVNELEPERNINRNVLFDVMMILQNSDIHNSLRDPRMKDIIISEYKDQEQMISKFDLTFGFTETREGLHVSLEYNSDLYTIDTAERMALHFEQLLQAIIDQSDMPVSHLNFLNAEEQHALLFTFNDTQSDYIDNRTIIELFETQVSQTPYATALIFEEKQFDYRKLNETVNQFANYLKEKYRPEADELFGVMLERSEWMVIVLLAILKTGAAYMPVSPDYPQDRIAYMQDDSRCKTLITKDDITVFLENADRFSMLNPKTVAAPNNLAYVIYTSGSSGLPKGVMVEHRNVVGFFQNLKSTFGFTTGMTLVAATNYTFDISVLELLGSVAMGMTVILVPEINTLDISGILKNNKVDALQITPSRLRQLLALDNENMQVLKKLRILLVGGEALSTVLYEKLKELSDTRVMNVYGPTETTIWSTCLDVSKSDMLSIGYPLLNETVFIVDRFNNLCPVGVPGEICIGRNGVSRGYLNRPELTVSKFVDNPFRKDERMYKTGDWATRLPDGSIRFEGRKDDQLKINGFRIELGEIESWLTKYAAVEEAVVIVREEAGEEKSMVAYLISKQALNLAGIRNYLREKLPAYMVPAHFIQLENLPLTFNGKLDKKSLPGPDAINRPADIEFIAPANEIEEKVLDIWRMILQRENIGVKDVFFDIGGNSLKLVMLHKKLSQAFPGKIALTDLFDQTTIQKISNYLRRDTSAEQIQSINI